MTTTAVLLAGGSGARMGSDLPKQLAVVAGRTVLEHTVAAFDASPLIDRIVLVARADLVETVEALVVAAGSGTPVTVVPGGASRAASTRCALTAIPDADGRVLVHDVARPLVPASLIAACVEALDRWRAVTAAIGSADTIVEASADGTTLERTLPRTVLRRVQTPQGFDLALLRAAHAAEAAAGDAEPTDDCQVVRRHRPDVTIGLVPGDERNLKITQAADLATVERLLGEVAR